MAIEYFLNLLILCELYLLLSLGLLIVLGWGGIFNLAQISLFGIGAYTVAILTTDYGVSPWIAFSLAPLFAAFFALLLGALSLRLNSDYFAIGSLAFALVTQTLFLNLKSVTHGVLGIPGIPRPTFDMISFDDNLNFFLLTSFFVLIALLFTIVLRRSAFGRSLVAQAEFEAGLSSLGISPIQRRIVAFCICAVFAGIAGGLFAWYISFIDPSSFSLPEMVFVVSIVVLSGMKNVRYLIIANCFLVLLPEALRFISLPSSSLGPMRQFLYALILFLIVFLRRDEIFPSQRSL